MEVFFTDLARQELDDAAEYLELEFEGLGDNFKADVKLAVGRISRHPLACLPLLINIGNRTIG